MTQSTISDLRKQKLIQFIITAKFGRNIRKCTATSFILQFKDKFRKLDEMQPNFASSFDENCRIMLIQNVVSAVPHLDRSRTDAHFLRAQQTMTSENYLNLLEESALAYHNRILGSPNPRLVKMLYIDNVNDANKHGSFEYQNKKLAL